MNVGVLLMGGNYWGKKKTMRQLRGLFCRRKQRPHNQERTQGKYLRRNQQPHRRRRYLRKGLTAAAARVVLRSEGGKRSARRTIARIGGVLKTQREAHNRKSRFLGKAKGAVRSWDEKPYSWGVRLNERAGALETSRNTDRGNLIMPQGTARRGS